jgi:hypothetical protein
MWLYNVVYSINVEPNSTDNPERVTDATLLSTFTEATFFINAVLCGPSNKSASNPDPVPSLLAPQAPISDNDHDTFAEPLNALPVLPIVNVLDVVSVAALVADVALVALVADVAVLALPFKFAVIVPAEKLPEASLSTILLAVLVETASAELALAFNAVWVAELTGLSASDVLSTLARPTSDLVILSCVTGTSPDSSNTGTPLGAPFSVRLILPLMLCIVDILDIGYTTVSPIHSPAKSYACV